MSTLRVPGHFSLHGGQALGARALRVAPHDLARERSAATGAQTCAHVWRHNMSQAAEPCAKLSRAAVRWALTGVVVHHLTVARIAQTLGVSWKSRQHCCPDRRPASTDQRPDPV